MAKHKPFDLTTHKRNRKGQIISTNHYRRICKGQTVFYERPPGSGNFYWPDGSVKELAKAEVEKKEKSQAQVSKASKLVASATEGSSNERTTS